MAEQTRTTRGRQQPDPQADPHASRRSDRQSPPSAPRPYGSGRVSPQRSLIAALAAEMPGAFTVAALARAAQTQAPSIGAATVYRAVAAMESSGWLERVGERSGSSLYLHCPDDDHHHHLVCTSCGWVESAACPIEQVVAETAVRSGFLVTDHEVTLYGLCASCREVGRGVDTARSPARTQTENSGA